MPGLRSVPSGDDAEPESGDVLAGLLNRSARGDIAAFERIYDDVAGAVLGLALRVVRNRAQAEEVAQDVMVEVWRSAARYAPERGSPMAWIMTIAHRRAVDRVRHEQASAERDDRVVARDERRPVDEVAEEVESRFERERTRRCLGTLTDLQRESVTLAYYDGYTYREVAQLLNTPLGTVKTRLRDGLIRLRDCMGMG
ncbi:sigma-70 family RNA polymerase sigma factor [Actinobacteria bacterium YIM 96077]|uniref:RNA polymerase sigma factor n=1 Tax=Phytoactinopolyspora halophila TaxID=1981511 RepID=A0A329QDS4_9ACTN|nr:ECF RNA polymerase sigma factor SigK [Phytoactinopolyspora halophila]AYY12680.1 sigma-70 family RNA polymerase sigma factor [Actinobacteria bacterium YIM 96077]RAW10593.1 RNA polymerase subunit sigma [Phytoactinopolyspora halophila]